MGEFRELEDQLKDLGCPLCSSGSFFLSWGGGPDPKRVEASCAHCGMIFVIDKEADSLRLPSLLRRRLQECGCVHCGSHFTRVSFRCEIDSYTDFFVVLCQDCSRAFPLKGGRRLRGPHRPRPPDPS